MREEIFHSTLDWQTREQLADAARKAQLRLSADRERYDLEFEPRRRMFEKMRLERAAQEGGMAGIGRVLAEAVAGYEAAKATLLARLDDLEK